MKLKVLLLFALLVSSTMAWAEDYTWDDGTKTLTIKTAGGWEVASIMYKSSCVHLIIADGVEISIGDAFENKTNLTTVTIGNSVTSIGQSAFSGCSNLATVTFADDSKLERIGASAFYNCTSLATVTIPSSVTSIGTLAFENCTGLTTVTFADGSKLESIESSAFSNCTSLATITIPSSVTSIYSNAFDTCTHLTTVTFEGTSLTTYGTSAFSSTDALTAILVPNDDAATAFKTGWSDYASKIHPITTALTANSANDAYWCTYYNGAINRLADENTTVYTASVSGSTATLTKVEDKIIKAGEGVVLKSTAESITLTYTTTAATDSYYTSNALEGVDAATTCDANTYYTLAKEDSGLGFYKYSGTSLAANKAYLPGTAVGAREFYLFDFDDETSTGVNDVRSKVTEGRGEYFNLSGQHVSKPTKGLYIVNGKKVVVK